ncbi:carboxypeptidase B-like [Lingula anatina]|uniref:Carboxypeptidase B-like n=1 Tax=Lingula anatina TaxID=7574 RepID=A0A1S3JAR7_LINAN|nr:carboxypeptidase B-like [Lingula anatina]|eukprot:XP_013407418.1 carboxypeptidase B-like [Lingula anatina]
MESSCGGKCSVFNLRYKSSKGRALRAIKIGTLNPQINKPAIWIDAGLHAREWIGISSALYFINKLISDYDQPEVKNLVDSYDWYILPVVNPDGYEYSHTNDRMWRKTRSQQDNDCYGVDANRNFNFHWNEAGTDPDPCHNTFAGKRAFSEPETQAMSDFILSKRRDIKIYISLHSYGNLWLTPWGYTRNLPGDYDELLRIANIAAAAILAVRGEEYLTGSAAGLLSYLAAGGSRDWAKGKAGIKYSYSVELSPSIRTADWSFRFELPPRFIPLVGEDLYMGLKAVAEALQEKLTLEMNVGCI